MRSRKSASGLISRWQITRLSATCSFEAERCPTCCVIWAAALQTTWRTWLAAVARQRSTRQLGQASSLLTRTITLIKDGSIEKTGLPKTHPLVKFAQTPDNIDCALSLDDTVIWGGLSLMADSNDKWIGSLAERLRDRKLYKCIDVRTKIAHDKDDGAASSSEADEVCAGIR